MSQHLENGYSAHVEIHLVVNGDRLRVAQVGPNSLILRDQCEIPPSTPGEIIISVDGDVERHSVILYEGVNAESKEVNFF